MSVPATHDSKAKLIDAAMNVVRAKGFTATRVDDICEAAGLTKGSFFHHFNSKEDLALAAAETWGTNAQALFAAAPYKALDDPRERLLGYVDFRKRLLQGALPEFTCFAGTTVQEVFLTHPAIRDACAQTIRDHIDVLEADIADVMRSYEVAQKFSARSLATYMQTVVQGAFVLAKAEGSRAVAAESLDHLRRYIELLFVKSKRADKRTGRR
jgi:TetR/AcrR family transcriptional regulator, transcriptional repressor for nem operon